MIKAIINFYLIRLMSLFTFLTSVSCGVFRANISIENKRIPSSLVAKVQHRLGIDFSSGFVSTFHCEDIPGEGFGLVGM